MTIFKFDNYSLSNKFCNLLAQFNLTWAEKNMRQRTIAKIVISIIILNIFLMGILVPLMFSILMNQNALYKEVNNINGNYTFFHLKLLAFDCNLIKRYFLCSDI